LIAEVGDLGQRTIASWLRHMEARRKELRSAARALPSAEALLQGPRQRLDAASDRLPRALTANAHIHHSDFLRAAARLSPAPLRAQTTRCRDKLVSLAERRARAMEVARHRRGERFAGLSARLAVALRANVEAHRLHIVRCRERTQALAERAAR